VIGLLSAECWAWQVHLHRLPPFGDLHGHRRQYRAGYDNFATDGVYYFHKGQDVAASGFLIFAIGEAIIKSTAAMDLQFTESQ
jgi:hypothetical protein